MKNQIKKGKANLILFSVLFLFVFLSSSLISATQINLNPSNGITIDYPEFDSLKQNVGFNLTIHPINTSGTNFLTGNLVSCYLKVENSSGDPVFPRKQLTPLDNSYNIALSKGNFTKTGIYHFYIPCNGTGLAGFATGTFLVTPNGQSGTPQNITFIIFIILAIYALNLFGFFGRNAILTLLSGMFLIFLGLYLVKNGIIIYRDDLTNYFAYVTTGWGFITSMIAAESLYKDL